MTTPDEQEPRIRPVVDPDKEIAAALAKTLATADGTPLNIFAALAHHPRLLKRFNVLGGMFLAHGLLSARQRELVVLRVAWRCRCEYEWGQHVLIGREAGVTDPEIQAVTQPLDANAWTPDDAALLHFTDETLDNTDVSDETWHAAAATLRDDQLLELVMLIGFYRMTAGLLNGVRVQREGKLPGWPESDAPAV